MKFSSLRVGATVALLTGLALASCGGSGGSNASGSDSVVQATAAVESSDGLVIGGETIADKDTYDKAKSQTLELYSGYTESSEQALISAFTADTGIKVNLIRLTPNKLSERILSEMGANKLAADVVRTSDYRIAKSFDEAGVWQVYEVPGADQFENVSIDGGKFTRMFNSIYTVGYNTQLVKPEDAPKSWADMVSGTWQGKIGIVQGGSGGSTAALNRFMQSKMGEDYFAEYAAQDPTIYDSLGAESTALARGEVSVGTVTVSGTNIAAVEDKAPIQFIVPEEGLVTYDYYLGMSSTAKNVEAAKVFLNYNFSERGQAVFAQIGEYPARTDVPAPVIMGIQLPPVDSDQVFRMSSEDAVKYGESDRDKWYEVFGYSG